MYATQQSSPIHINPQAFSLYALNDDCECNILYFLLDSSRYEPSLKRAKIMMGAAHLIKEKSIQETCYDLANELIDLEQMAQKHSSLVRERCSEVLIQEPTLAYLLERIEGQPLEAKPVLLGSINGPMGAAMMDGALHSSWVVLHKEIGKFSHEFESFLHRIATGYYSRSGREALAEMRAEETAKKKATESVKAA